MALNFIFLLLCFTLPLQVVYSSRKLDETTVPTGDQKCTPCGDTVYSSPPPPPPALPPPSPPPPSPKKSPSSYCPPPPPSFIYITGPPAGNLYPVDENFNSASRRTFLPAAAVLPALLTLLLGFW